MYAVVCGKDREKDACQTCTSIIHMFLLPNLFSPPLLRKEFQKSAPFLAFSNALHGCVPLTQAELWAIFCP